MGFFRQEYWSGLSFPLPGKSSWHRDWTWVSRITGRFFTFWATRDWFHLRERAYSFHHKDTAFALRKKCHSLSCGPFLPKFNNLNLRKGCFPHIYLHPRLQSDPTSPSFCVPRRPQELSLVSLILFIFVDHDCISRPNVSVILLNTFKDLLCESFQRLQFSICLWCFLESKWI